MGDHHRCRITGCTLPTNWLRSKDFVAAGGGLIVLAETEQKKYGNVLGDLAGRFGIDVVSTTVQDPVHRFKDVSTWVLGQHGPKTEHDLLAEVSGACFYRAGVLRLTSPEAFPVLVTSSDATVAECAAHRRCPRRGRPGRRRRRLGSLRRRLHRRSGTPQAVAQPRHVGRDWTRRLRVFGGRCIRRLAGPGVGRPGRRDRGTAPVCRPRTDRSVRNTERVRPSWWPTSQRPSPH